MNKEDSFTKDFIKNRLPISLLLILFCCLLTACGSGSAVTITIAGKEVPMNGKLQTCIDNGLITTNSSGDEVTLATNMSGREVSFESIHLGNSKYPRKTPVTVNCYNPSSSTRSIYECSIMDFTYSPRFDSADQAQILINGIDFWGMTKDEAITALETLGYEIKFQNDSYIKLTTGKVSWKLECMEGIYFDSESSDPQKTVVEFDPETLYISSVNLSIRNTLNITTK